MARGRASDFFFSYPSAREAFVSSVKAGALTLEPSVCSQLGYKRSAYNWPPLNLTSYNQGHAMAAESPLYMALYKKL